MIKLFTLLMYTVCLIVGVVYLVKGYIEHESVLHLCVRISWVVVAVSWLAVAYRKWSSNREQPPENEQKNSVISQDWQQYRLGVLAVFLVLSIPMATLLTITIFNEVKYHPKYIVRSPLFETINSIGLLLTAIGYLIQSIDTLVEVKKKAVKQILTYLSGLAFISGFIMFMIYAFNLTEVT